MIGGFKDQAEKDQYASDERERERQNTVLCPHCDTSGVHTYSGVVGPWSKDDGKRLTEFSERLHWTGTHEMGREHTAERCASVTLERLDGHLRAIIVYAKAGSELEKTALYARNLIERARFGGPRRDEATRPPATADENEGR
jgi:hypothetical protein